jgi:transcriptional regulator with XRE-family HTH domain
MLERLATNTRTVSDNINAIMVTRGLSQSEISRMSGVSQKTISNLCNAKHSVQIEGLAAIAHALRVPTWTLLIPGAYTTTGTSSSTLVKLLGAWEDIPADGQETLAILAQRERERAKRKTED